MIIRGRIHKLPDNVDTDLIIPARYLVTTDPKELGKHCLEGWDPAFPSRVKGGDIIVAGENFGCGSSREHAPLAIKGCGISLVIAKSFARIFLRNAVNTGLPVLISEDIPDKTQEGEELEVDLEEGRVKNLTRSLEWTLSSFPPFLRDIISAGGLLDWYKKEFQKR